MNRLPILIFTCLCLACGTPVATGDAAEATADIPLAGKRVMILGNSITQNGLWVSYLEYFLRSAYPEASFDIVSIGLSSETVSCLTEPDHPFPRPCVQQRLYRALEKVKPEMIIACYGMNDGIYHPFSERILAEYQRGINELAGEVVMLSNLELILLSPPPFDSLPIADRLVGSDAPEFGYKTPYEGYDQVLGRFSQLLMDLEIRNLQTIDLHGPMNAYISQKRTVTPDFSLAQDGIHPGPEGHELMARTVLAALDVPLPDTVADNLFQLVHQRRKIRSEAWLPYVGYVMGDSVFTESVQDAERQVAELESQIQAMIR